MVDFSVLVAALVALPIATQAQTLVDQTLYSFTGANDGALPEGVVQDRSGNLFGLAGSGGDFNQGVLFELANTGNGAWTQTVLCNFGGDSGFPSPGLTLDQTSGTLYGTTTYGANNSGGNIFSFVPDGNGSWTFNVLYTLLGTSDGDQPDGGLLLTPAGSLIGTTKYGGNFQAGVIFELQPPLVPGAAWTYSVLYSFDPSRNCDYPSGPLAIDEQGDVFGAASGGGRYGSAGTVWELSPGENGSWSFQVIFRLVGSHARGNSTGLVRRASDGVLFGGSNDGGAFGFGSVYKLAPPAVVGQVWRAQVLYSFTGGADGCGTSALVLSSHGTLYGAGGGDSQNISCPTGSIFRLTPPAEPHSNWSFTKLFEDDHYPFGPLLLDRTGLYGTDYLGGVNSEGSVFLITTEK